VLILTLGGEDGGIIRRITGGGEDDTVPPFEFSLGKTAVIATVRDADDDALQSQADDLVREITPVLDDLYTNAFLDPTNWRDGDYEEVLASFADDALPAAQSGLETLTLGAGAGDVYERVTPKRGVLSYRVLFDQDGVPDTVVAQVTFSATGQRKDGTYVAIVSTGEWFLNDEGGWTVTAFDVSRADHETKPPPSPTPSTSGASTSP
jgi:hypothetical protein